jgi:hypothetical protein
VRKMKIKKCKIRTAHQPERATAKAKIGAV